MGHTVAVDKGRIEPRPIPPGGAALVLAAAQFAAEGPGALVPLSDVLTHVGRSLSERHEQLEFLSLDALSGQLLVALDEPILPIMDAHWFRAAVSVACGRLPEECLLAKSGTFPGAHAALARTLAELQLNGLFATELKALAAAAQGHLVSKLDALASLAACVEDTAENIGIETLGMRLRRCIEIQSPISEPMRILIAGFDAAMPLHLEWLRWASERGVRIQVLIETVRGDPTLFQSSRRNADTLFGTWINSVSDRWYTKVFDPPAQPRPSVDGPDQGPQIIMEVTVDALSECEWALRGCQKLLSEGYEPTQLAILARDPASYAPLLISTAARMEVPLSAAVSMPLLSNTLAALLLGVLENIGWSDPRRLSRALSSSYLIAEHAGRRALQNKFTAAYAERARCWIVLKEWALDPEAPGWLGALLEWREEALEERRTLPQWSDALAYLVELLGLSQAASTATQTRSRDAAALKTALESIRSLAQAHQAVGSAPTGLREFVRHCRSEWENRETSAPAATLGVRLVASPEELEGVRALTVLEMLEGVIPRRRIEDTVLGDAERLQIDELRPTQPRLIGSIDTSARERDLFARILATPNERLTLMYSEVDEERDNVPAFYLKLVKQLRPGVSERERPRALVAPSPAECLCGADSMLRAALDGEPWAYVAPELISDEARDALRGDLMSGIAIDELTRALKCTFQASFRHRLKLFPKSRRNPWIAIRMLPELAGLNRCATREDAAKALETALQATIAELMPSEEPWTLQMLQVGARREFEQAIDREFAARKLWPREVEKIRRNVAFGDSEINSEVPIRGGRRIRFEGKVGSLAWVNGRKTLQMFNRHEPKLSPERIDLTNTLTDDSFEYGLYLMALAREGPDVAVELDAGSAGRFLVQLGGSRPIGCNEPKLKGITIDEKVAQFWRNVKEVLADAADVLEKGEPVATPGEHCKHCDYGELCRTAPGWGENISPFEVGTGP